MTFSGGSLKARAAARVAGRRNTSSRRSRLQHAAFGEQGRVPAELQRLQRLGRRVHDSRASRQQTAA